MDKETNASEPSTIAEIEQWYRSQLEIIHKEVSNTASNYPHPGMASPGGGNMTMGGQPTTLHGQIIRERLNSVERERAYYYQSIGCSHQHTWGMSSHGGEGGFPRHMPQPDQRSIIEKRCSALRDEIANVGTHYLEVDDPEDLDELDLDEHVACTKVQWFEFESIYCNRYLRQIELAKKVTPHVGELTEAITNWQVRHKPATDINKDEADAYFYITRAELEKAATELFGRLKEIAEPIPPGDE